MSRGRMFCTRQPNDSFLKIAFANMAMRLISYDLAARRVNL